MTTTPKTIMYDSPEAASLQTITGWVSRTGRFWGDDEHMARFDGATHQVCKGNPTHGPIATNSYCRQCRDERMAAKFDAMPRREYDGTPVVVHDSDIYFFDAESLTEWLHDNDIKPEDARLVFCKPQYPRIIEPNEYYCDDLPEDGEVSATLQAAFDAMNKIIEASPPLSWTEGDVAVTLPADFLKD